MNQSVLKMLLPGVVLLTAFPASSSDFTVNGISYKILNIDAYRKVAVTSIESNGVIPEKVYWLKYYYEVVAIEKLEQCDVETLIMPNSIVDIADGAFEDSELKRVVFSDQIKSIPNEAFYSCDSLQSIVFPAELERIGVRAFWGCTSLQSVDLPDGLQHIGYNAFFGCTSLQSAELPDDLKYMGNRAFSGCASLQSVDLPDGLQSIGDRTFYGCTSLRSVDLPDGLKYMGEYAFYGCASLQSVALPNDLKHIEDYAFHECTSLQSVDFPDGLIYIGKWAFSGCASLRSVELPDDLKYIDDYAFYECTSLQSVNLSTVALIGNYIFEGCTLIQNVKFRANSRNSGVNSKKRSLNRIADNMFSGFESIESVEILDGILEIGNYAFEGCKQLTEVSFPDGLIAIGLLAFQETKIKRIVFPKSMLYIGKSSFHNIQMISYISEVVSLNPEPPYCYGFNYDNNICAYATLSVPAGSKQKYLSHSSDWHVFTTINEIGQPGAVENIKDSNGIKVNVQDGTIHIDGIEEESPVYVYDLSGRLVDYGISSEILHVDSAGVYLVRVMGETYKVFVGK